MIRIQLVHEGRVVKQISSRLHEGIILEQVKLYKDPVDAIIIVEGQLSEDAKSILQHVAKKIVPAAMAAGIAMSGAGHAQAQGGANPHYPGLNHSVGQHMADIFNPNYKELVARRKYEKETQRREWVAQQEEIRRARVANARASGRQQTGQSVSNNSVKVYDQANLTGDRKAYILYDMENRIKKIPVAGTDFVPGDSQRLPHYITSSGNIYYVRHPAQSVASENIIEDGAETKAESDKGYSDASNGINKNPYNPGSPSAKAYDDGQQAYKRHFGEGVDEAIGTIGTVGTIPASGASGNTAMTKKTQFDKPGSTTNATFNAKGQLEIDPDDLDDEAIDALKKGGIDVTANKGGVTEALGQDPELKAILDQYPEAVTGFKNGEDISDYPDFYEALFTHYSENGEMPYGTQKARDGDPIDWLSDRLNDIIGDSAPMGESEEEDNEASPADQAGADKNIIMQIRKAADYEKPTALTLTDGNSMKIDAAIANGILSKFNNLRPSSKELLQQTLNTKEGFVEILNYLGQREVTESANDVDLISKHMAPVVEAQDRASRLIKSVFGK